MVPSPPHIARHRLPQSPRCRLPARGLEYPLRDPSLPPSPSSRFNTMLSQTSSTPHVVHDAPLRHASKQLVPMPTSRILRLRDGAIMTVPAPPGAVPDDPSHSWAPRNQTQRSPKRTRGGPLV